MMFLQINSYNLDVAKVFGVYTAVFLSCLDNEFEYQSRAHSISEDKSISLSRAEIYERTALDDEQQADVELSLSQSGVLIVKPLKNIPNKNYYSINYEQLNKILLAEDPSKVLGEEKANQLIRKPRVEPISKRKNRILQLKKKITVQDPVIQQYLCDWIDAVYTNPKGFLSPTGVTIAQEELLAYAEDSQEKQIAILKIAIKGGLRDMTWAIQRYEEQAGVGTKNFMDYNDKKHIATENDIDTDEVF